jgi:uncharacterized protein
MQSNIFLKELIFSVLAIFFVFIFPHTGIMPFFSYVFPVLLFAWFYLKRSGENFASVGFSFKRFEWRSVWMGALTGIGLFCFINYIFFPLAVKVLPLAPANLDDFKNVRHNPSMYLFVLTMGWLVGGLYEEIIFHGFVFSRIEKLLPRRYATIGAVACTAFIFSLYHVQLGMSGMLNALLAGLGYHLVMLRNKRNIWYAFFAHGVFDTIGITCIYLGYW